MATLCAALFDFVILQESMMKKTAKFLLVSGMAMLLILAACDGPTDPKGEEEKEERVGEVVVDRDGGEVSPEETIRFDAVTLRADSTPEKVIPFSLKTRDGKVHFLRIYNASEPPVQETFGITYDDGGGSFDLEGDEKKDFQVNFNPTTTGTYILKVGVHHQSNISPKPFTFKIYIEVN